MSTSNAPQREANQVSRPRFQFSLGWLMLGVSIVCLMLGLWEILPRGLVGYLFVMPLVFGVVPTVLVICTIYARGDIQAFAIGALVPLSSLLLIREIVHTAWGILMWVVVVGGTCGALAVFVRRRLLNRDDGQ
jgi:hypothetical protein